MPKDSSNQSSQKQSNNYIAVLQSAGYRITAQRALICRYLATTERHPTPYQIYADVQALDPAISRATVYNTLNTLQQLGAIVEINFGADHTHYDTDPAPHINLICLRCHAIEDCHCALPVDGALQANIAHHDFQAVATKIDVLGLCKACRQVTQT